jgi:hypothetical protein
VARIGSRNPTPLNDIMLTNDATLYTHANDGVHFINGQDVIEGLTGSEIEAVFGEALYQSFDADQEPTDLTVAGVLGDFVPLSKLMAKQISALRSWAKGRARLATSPVQEKGLRKMPV